MNKKFNALEAQKELLMMKAELERMEMGANVQDLRTDFAWVNVFKQFSGWLGRRNMRALGPLARLGGPRVQEGLRKHPLLGMVASSLLVRFSAPLAKVALKAGLGAAVLALGTFWFQTRSPWASRALPHDSSNEPVVSTTPGDS